MQVLLDVSVLNEFHTGIDNGKKKQLFNIFYNPNVSFLFPKTYLDSLEKNIQNKELFQSFITELFDSNRLVAESSKMPKDNLDVSQEFLHYLQTNKETFFFALSSKENPNFVGFESTIVFVNNGIKPNKNWLILELLSNSFINLSYQDFKSDKEITTLFKELLSVPVVVKSVTLFDRDPAGNDLSLLKELKGKNIEYYTLFRDGRRAIHELKDKHRKLKSLLGGKLKLFWTRNSEDIHERKIIIDGLLITVDNSFGNLSISDPTWELTVVFSREKAKKWKEKCNRFSLLDN